MDSSEFRVDVQYYIKRALPVIDIPGGVAFKKKNKPHCCNKYNNVIGRIQNLHSMQVDKNTCFAGGLYKSTQEGLDTHGCTQETK